MASEKFDRNPKIRRKIVGQTFLKSATGANVFFDFLNHKNEEIMPKKYFLLPVLFRSKIVFEK